MLSLQQSANTIIHHLKYELCVNYKFSTLLTQKREYDKHSLLLSILLHKEIKLPVKIKEQYHINYGHKHRIIEPHNLNMWQIMKFSIKMFHWETKHENNCWLFCHILGNSLKLRVIIFFKYFLLSSQFSISVNQQIRMQSNRNYTPHSTANEKDAKKSF